MSAQQKKHRRYALANLAALIAFGLVTAFAVQACDDIGDATRGGCKMDRDCGTSGRCAVATGICSHFTTPLEVTADGGR